jgi:ADP-ribose pyrophosphatase
MSPARTRKRKPTAKVLSSNTSFKGKVFSVTSDKVIEPNGVTATRDVVRHSGSVVVLAVDDSGREPRVLLERQYRYAAGDYLWEVPAGRIDEGERPLAAGKRELREETGYTAKWWRRILFFYPSPGFMDETMTIFLARGLKFGEAQPEEDERIEYKLVPLSEAVRMIATGKICDGKTIAAILWFRGSLRQGKARGRS